VQALLTPLSPPSFFLFSSCLKTDQQSSSGWSPQADFRKEKPSLAPTTAAFFSLSLFSFSLYGFLKSAGGDNPEERLLVSFKA